MIIERAFIISMIVFFIHATTWDGQINSWIRKLINEKSKISNPIYNCPICMTPYWGTVMYLVFWGWDGWIDCIATVGCAAGMSVISVVMIHANDYFRYRTPKDEESCCPTSKPTNEPTY